MFYSPRRTLPAVDYVSIVRSLYADPRSLLYGVLSSTSATLASAIHSGDVALYVIAFLFNVVGVLRYLDMRAFARDNLDPDDAARAAHWEARATIGGGAYALLHGMWCFLALLSHNDFATLSSALVSVAALMGTVNRNFALDRLVTLQVVCVAVPLELGLFLRIDPFHATLGVLLFLYMASIRQMASNLRDTLLGAVHKRIEADRLALELDAALTTMPLGLCMLDAHGRIAVVNRRAREMFPDLTPERSLGVPFTHLIEAAMRDGTISPPLAQKLHAALTARSLTGQKLVITVSPLLECEVTITVGERQTVVMFEDITERVRANERINYMAHFDGLTGLPNRSHFTELAETDLLQKHVAHSRERAMLMLIDLDDFKHVNDTFGHPVGDALLAEAGRRIRSVIEARGIVARFGGDEFTVFRPRGGSRRSAERDATAILNTLGKPFLLKGETMRVNASIGVVIAGADDDLATLLTRADLALYQAKANGKAQWSMFQDVMDVDYRLRQRLKADLRDAIAAGELTLVYQPIVDIRDRRIIGCEALARWHHKELGRISPAQFIPIAEEIGVISDLSRFVLAAATRQCREWPEPMKVAVNLSVTDFRTSDVSAMVRNALRESGLAQERLEVEITESTLIEEKDAVVSALGDLRQFGVGLALDDFGTGYSSLSYLHSLPFTKLKIDRSFVVDVATNERSQTLLRNIARLSKDMEMTVTVEGIETEAQLETIGAIPEVDQAQGFLFGVPLPARELGELIARMPPRPDLPTLESKRLALVR